jgi:hypothetical protein
MSKILIKQRAVTTNKAPININKTTQFIKFVCVFKNI